MIQNTLWTLCHGLTNIPILFRILLGLFTYLTEIGALYILITESGPFIYTYTKEVKVYINIYATLVEPYIQMYHTEVELNKNTYHTEVEPYIATIP